MLVMCVPVFSVQLSIASALALAVAVLLHRLRRPASSALPATVVVGLDIFSITHKKEKSESRRNVSLESIGNPGGGGSGVEDMAIGQLVAGSGRASLRRRRVHRHATYEIDFTTLFVLLFLYTSAISIIVSNPECTQ